MEKQLTLLAERLKAAPDSVILYGVSTLCIALIKQLERRYQLAPACVCDGDKEKWGQKVGRVEILSPEEALRRWPDAGIMVTSRVYKYQIIGQLVTDAGIPPERILNYEPVARRRSCIYLECMMIAARHRLYLCDSWFEGVLPPYVRFDGDCKTSMDQCLAWREEILRGLAENRPTVCKDCPYIKEDYFPAEDKVRIFNYSEAGACNFKCSYCSYFENTKRAEPAGKYIDCGELFQEMERRGMLSEDLSVDLTCGEISIHPQKDEIYDAIKNAPFIASCTNAAVYDVRIAQLMEEGRGAINVSMDAGTAETFRKIKGHDMYQAVCENLKRYSQTGGVVELKYIVLPGINDNEADIDGFAALCSEVNADMVSITYDLNQPPEELSNPQTVWAMRRLTEALKQRGLLYKFYFYIERLVKDLLSGPASQQ